MSAVGISIGTGIALAAGAGAVGTVAAGALSAGAVTSSTNASIAAQEQAQAKQQALNAPYAAIGTGTTGNNGAISQYENLLGLGPQGTAGEEATLASMPGYQFAKQQGLGATENAATLTNPGGISGNTLTALDTFGTGLADSTYQSAVGNAQNAVTIGQNAAAGTGAGVLQTGANVGTTLANEGNTIAGIDANVAAGLTKDASGSTSNLITANTLANLTAIPGAGVGSDPLLKPQTVSDM